MWFNLEFKMSNGTVCSFNAEFNNLNDATEFVSEGKRTGKLITSISDRDALMINPDEIISVFIKQCAPPLTEESAIGFVSASWLAEMIKSGEITRNVAIKRYQTATDCDFYGATLAIDLAIGDLNAGKDY